MKKTSTTLSKVVAIMALLYTSLSFAQDAGFSQFYATETLVNPAYAGSYLGHKIEAAQRMQWRTVNDAYRTSYIGYHHASNRNASGIGGYFMHDVSADGALQQSTLGLQYGHGLKINNKWHIRFGYEAAWVQKQLDWDKLSFSDEIDPSQGFVFATQQPRGENFGFLDVSAGGVVFAENFYFGASIDHLTNPYDDFLESNNRLALTYSLQSGYTHTWRQSDDVALSVSPNIIYKQQDEHQIVQAGFYLKRENITVGGWYTTNQQAVFLLGFETRHQKFGYSYDLNFGKLQMAQAGTHELTYGLLIPGHVKRTRYKTIDCPSF